MTDNSTKFPEQNPRWTEGSVFSFPHVKVTFGEGEKDGIVRDHQVADIIICISGVYQ